MFTPAIQLWLSIFPFYGLANFSTHFVTFYEKDLFGAKVKCPKTKMSDNQNVQNQKVGNENVQNQNVQIQNVPNHNVQIQNVRN
jgi:hypothetical protein